MVNMAKKRTHSETEFLRGRVKELSTENRSLKRQLGRSSKAIKQFENFLGEDEAEEQLEDQKIEESVLRKDSCPKCSSELESVVVGNRKLFMCTSCNYRMSKKSG
jgi:formamidopyrimidine-DNA glycosylase